jgi:hypothetical protein
VDDRFEDWILRTASGKVREESIAKCGESRGALRDRDLPVTALGDLVHDVIGIPSKPVQRVHMGPLERGQHQGGPVVGSAVPLIELPAQFIRLIETDRPCG